MKTFKIRKSIYSDILPIAVNMRNDDAKEVWDSNLYSPYKALCQSFNAGEKAWTVVVNGVPVGMLGVSRKTLLSNTGVPWLLGTDELVLNKRWFFETSIRILNMLKRGFTSLENYVSEENKLSLLWLKKLGFSFSEKHKSITNVGFIRFYMDV